MTDQNKDGSTLKRTFDLLASAAVVFTLLFIALQWREMKEGGKDTHELAVQAKAQADAAKAQADKMADSVRKTDDLIKESTEQTRATNRLATEAKRSADIARRSADISSQSLETARLAMRVEQRAWVGPMLTEIAPEPLEPNKFIEIGVTISNTGKTPAYKVTGYAMYDFVANGAKPNLSTIRQSSEEISKGTLFPGATAHFLKTTHPVQPSDDVLNGRSTIYVFGIITYVDIFNRNHWTHFCFWYAPWEKRFLTCDTYNDTDDSK
ncbi:MAG: hypothetical protein LAO20_01445 [Acidobacteriia bacterium]|nr:hypothetical protein [Terriglobia bacterium]